MQFQQKTFRFREFPVYKDARYFSHKVKKTGVQFFPSIEKFSLLSQLCRAADSVVLNIAEGTDRSTDKDFAHFLNLARTSLSEVVACLDIATDNKYITEIKRDQLISDATKLAHQLTAFRSNLIKKPTK